MDVPDYFMSNLWRFLLWFSNRKSKKVRIILVKRLSIKKILSDFFAEYIFYFQYDMFQYKPPDVIQYIQLCHKINSYYYSS